MNRLKLHTIGVAAALLMFAGAAGAQQTGGMPQHKDQADKAQPTSEMASKCQAMMAQHEKMMADRKAADSRLDALVAKMNSASGQAKVDATAAAVAEIVSQRKTMHESMMQMQHGAMMHMGEHMKAGAESMAMCPMMKAPKH